jgi:serine/threonine-protein kinase
LAYLDDRFTHLELVGKGAMGIQILIHPNLIRVYEVFQGGLPNFSMEYLEAESLRERYPPGQAAPLSEFFTLALALVSGLAYTHSKGIIHRDLKPQNILLAHPDRVKIIDFGIAHFHRQSALTSPGQVLGTPLYMAPEQAQGREVDARSDIFSLGVVLFELLTGELPFPDMMTRLATRPPGMPTHRGVPATLEQVVRKSLEIHPEERYQSMGDLFDGLQAAREICNQE